MIIWMALIIYLFLIRILVKDFNSKRNQKIYLIFASIGIILVMSLRYPEYEVVYDLSVYYNDFLKIGKTSWNTVFSEFRYEAGYLVLNKLLYAVCPWGQIIFIIYSMFSVYCVSNFIYKNSNHPFLSIMIYVTLGTMIFQLTAFRQAIATGICLLSIEYIKSKKIKKFLIFVLIATLFHKSSIVFGLAYFLINKKIVFFKNFFLIISARFLALFFTSFGNLILNMEYKGYIGSKFGGFSMIFIFLVTIIFTYVKRSKIKNYIGFNMTVLGLFLYLMRYTTLIIERTSFYFTTGVIIAIPEVIYSIKNKNIRFLVKYIVLIMAIILFFKRANQSDWGIYRFFWE